MEIVLIIIYAIPLLFVFAYSIIQLNLVFLYRKNQKKRTEDFTIELTQYPKVTVQLPLYNEKYVVQRLIHCMCNLDYPKSELEIQVLDDSTDESFDIAAELILDYQKKGINIKHIKRTERTGFKAGALAYGLQLAEGEFIAIFDADFLPSSNFLITTIKHFNNPNIGIVQTKWGHLNKNHSLITKLQAFGLDAHFSVEQVGRSEGSHFINFNGTGGIWRKQCIVDAGGWSADTLTEDLDLSYRAQLKGWKFKYLEDVVCSAELPIAMNALKNQQFRWTKGAAECAVKNLVNVFKNNKINTFTKVHALFHLLNSSIFICIVLMSLLSVPLLIIKENSPQFNILFKMASFFISSLFILIVFYWTSFKKNSTKPFILKFIIRFVLFLSVSMGLSLHNSLAVLEGFMGKKSPFLRTPKFNVATGSNLKKWASNSYLRSSISLLSIFEFIFAMYFMTGIYMAFKFNDYGLLPFHIMLTFGYLYVFFNSTFHSIVSLRSK